MAVREVKKGIWSCGAMDWDRRLFDELIPLPDGTTYNSYLIRGSEKTALIDTVDPTKEKVLLDNLRELGVDRIDYVISHHGEQDHSGSIPAVLDRFKTAKVVTNAKCRQELKDHLLVPDDRFMVVEDRQTLSLGDRTLEFIFAPWVHWPETLLTYLKEDGILFTCDFFGSHLATSNLYAINRSKVLRSAKRYYAEIMMPFRAQIRNNLEKIKDMKFDIVATSHGPIYNDPEMIISAYREWVSDEVKNEVVIPYVSMHGSTARMIEHLIEALMKRDITVKPFNLSRTDIGELAMALVDTATIVIGTPTVLAGPHPLAAYAAMLANALRPKARFASVVMSYGWGGKAIETLAGLMPNLKAEMLPPVTCNGYPKDADLKALEDLADAILNRHRGSELVKTCKGGK